MKSIPLLASLALACALIGPSLAADAPQDWPNLAAYRAANARLGAPAQGEERIVLMGDSITEFWAKSQLKNSYINRGISGQTTPQMLLRFRSDVIDLHPKVVVILAGTNDIAGNTGAATLDMIQGNIASMAELARAHGIKVVLGSVLPASSFYWNPAIKPADKIVALNAWIRDFAQRNRFVYIDYYSPMVDEHKGLKRAYSGDGVHPNEAGYQVMAKLLEQAIATATAP